MHLISRRYDKKRKWDVCSDKFGLGSVIDKRLAAADSQPVGVALTLSPPLESRARALFPHCYAMLRDAATIAPCPARGATTCTTYSASVSRGKVVPCHRRRDR